MENTNIITAEQQVPNNISANNSIFNVQALSQLTAFAELMSAASIAIPDHLAGKPSDCMAIVMQSMQWGMNPYAVAQKTFFVGGKIGYEAQLISAILSSTGAIRGHFHYQYEGDWSKCTSTKEVTTTKNGRNGNYDKTERVRAWSDEDEEGLYVVAGAVIKGETEITWCEPVYLSSIVIRNSPLWATNPKQQIAYLATKYWSRLYCPAAVMGFQDADDLAYREEKVINPEPIQRMSVKEITAGVETTTSAQESTANIDTIADEFRDRIDSAETIDQVEAVGNEINAAKAILGAALHTELKNKATRRYHLVKHRNALEAAINSLPQPGEPDAATRFADVEKTLTAAKRHLTDELFDQFSITLADMRPEYIAD